VNSRKLSLSEYIYYVDAGGVMYGPYATLVAAKNVLSNKRRWRVNVGPDEFFVIRVRQETVWRKNAGEVWDAD